MIAFLVLIALVLLVMINVPIAVAIGIVSLIGMLITNSFDAIYNVALSVFDGASNFSLLAIPLFILAGALMNTGGISVRLINFVNALIGFVRGGLAMVNVGVSMIFAEISGSSVADVAALGSILIPAMKKRGYKSSFSAAVTSSSASLAVIIPPSLPMIIYGAMADVSISKLFVAGLAAGGVASLGMFAVCYYYAVKYNLPREEHFSLSKLCTAFKNAFWALTLPVLILGGIISGFTTATEAAGLAVLLALIIGFFIYKELTLNAVYKALVESVNGTSVVMLLVATSAVLGLFLTEQKVPQQMAAAILNISDNKYIVLMMLNVMLFIVGMFLHGAAAIILVVPIVMPLITQLGIDPIHFGIILTLNIAVGQQTPPVASVLITASSIAKKDIWSVTKDNVWFIVVLLISLMMVTYIPALTIGMVDLFY
ncbi:TPA: TRAP transporter large permease [Pasteurella multocida]|uniref:TRAP transporter large permease protein n=1 Tax=Pasteurella multocida TaxID=747 RepID=A0AAW8V8H4_PASMD|nr:TRAP transporter large permease [Pasteurella multocida]ARB73490.1 TRAP transporter large permease [Pasteurella multocida]EJZ77604.1 TRAP-type4-dicarboxylate transport system, large permease component [Pasteurella multocida subsp. gallicida X73]MCL7798490.1 TRAP transporter large permease [Pasteurella multocida]MCL7802397.1 TRAP transporter large permease [Pasteurella multocida]MCL7826397.1 TRAP transporter large permease [Pasteurella multocida]